MSLRNPVFGLGLDSYGDWYRELRGEVATVRTGPDRIANTAHNIYLDISASGGFPLVLAYAIILIIAARAAFKVIKRTSGFNPYFTALFSAWVAYLIQAGVSINQVGVGIWGWLFTGSIIGYEIATRSDILEGPKKSRLRNGAAVPMPATAALLGITGFVLGFILAFIPFQADAQFRKASATGDASELAKSVTRLGASSFHYELALDAAIKRGDEVEIARLAEDLLRRYPRDFMGWRVVQALETLPESRRVEAYQILRSLDPYNPSITPLP